LELPLEDVDDETDVAALLALHQRLQMRIPEQEHDMVQKASQLRFKKQKKAILVDLAGRGGGGASGASAANYASMEDADLSTVAEDAEEDDDEDLERTCAICKETPQLSDLTLTPCAHVFCFGCLSAWLPQSRKCPTCRMPVTAAQCYRVDVGTLGKEIGTLSLEEFYQQRERQAAQGEEEGEGGSSAASSSSSSGSSSSSSASASAASQQAPLPVLSPPRRGIAASLAAHPQAQLIPSSEVVNEQAIGPDHASYGSKVSSLCRRLKLIAEAGDKAIAVSTWPPLLQLVHKTLTTEGMGSVVLHGTPSERAEAARQFSQNPSVRVLLLNAATDCAGLNLVAGNHLFLLDPVLSEQVVAQLVGRICRMGQTKHCTVVHCVTENTVEEGMLRQRLRRTLTGGQGSSSSSSAASTVASAADAAPATAVTHLSSAVRRGEDLSLEDICELLSAGEQLQPQAQVQAQVQAQPASPPDAVMEGDE
jgi:hypothetical protein